ncbi:unnamed protein product [Urochloa humidicola]
MRQPPPGFIVSGGRRRLRASALPRPGPILPGSILDSGRRYSTRKVNGRCGPTWQRAASPSPVLRRVDLRGRRGGGLRLDFPFLLRRDEPRGSHLLSPCDSA